LVLALNLLGDGLRDYFDPKKADGKPEKILRKLFTIRWRRTSFKTRIQADK
jgi:hypothetical protein